MTEDIRVVKYETIFLFSFSFLFFFYLRLGFSGYHDYNYYKSVTQVTSHCHSNGHIVMREHNGTF